jgi:hypothetical protein
MKYLTVIGFALILSATACSLLEPTDTTPKDPRPPEKGGYSEEQKAECDALGGTYKPAGMLGHFRCNIPYSDGGQACTNSSDCEGKCLASEDTRFDPKYEKRTSGKCQMTDNPFGCNAEIRDGKVQPALCVD